MLKVGGTEADGLFQSVSLVQSSRACEQTVMAMCPRGAVVNTSTAACVSLFVGLVQMLGPLIDAADESLGTLSLKGREVTGLDRNRHVGEKDIKLQGIS